MTPSERDELKKRREALKQEIATLKKAIADIDTPAFYGRSKQEHLESMRTVQGMRERELNDVEDQLAERT